jgi:hypothetical protein
MYCECFYKNDKNFEFQFHVKYFLNCIGVDWTKIKLS